MSCQADWPYRYSGRGLHARAEKKGKPEPTSKDLSIRRLRVASIARDKKTFMNCPSRERERVQQVLHIP